MYFCVCKKKNQEKDKNKILNYSHSLLGKGMVYHILQTIIKDRNNGLYKEAHQFNMSS